MDLMRIPGPSGQEAAVSAAIRDRLVAAGVPRACVSTDDAHRKSPAGGETGNLIVRLPGTTRGPRRLLMAHMDTVPLCVGCVPERRGQYIESANPHTGLGADNRSGAAVVLTAAVEIFERRLPHPPLTLLWSVQEEFGLFGTRFVDRTLLARPKLAFNWDGRGPHRITLAATGGISMDIRVRGVASHAGGAPERGVSAIAIAGLAIHDIVTAGWHGDIQRGRRHGTSNLGIIQGGDATHSVTDFVRIQAEVRSHDAVFRDRIVRQITRAFERAARKVRNDKGTRGSVDVQSTVEYESFRLESTAASVQAAATVIRSLGLEPEMLTSNSALDANWMNFHGIPTATLGAGQLFGHTTEECMDVEQFAQACRVALRLATAIPG